MRKLGRTFRIRKKKRNKTLFFDDSIEELYIWMRNKKFQMKKVKPALFNDTGRGLKSYEVINAGDVLISVPYNSLITYETVMSSYLHIILSKYHQSLSTMEMISVFLMCEKLKGSSSYWHPYIKSLPIEYVLPATFPLEILNCIPKIVAEVVKQQNVLLKKTFKRLKKLLDAIENHFKEFFGLLTYEIFQWSWLSVNTRCIYMKSVKINNDPLRNHNDLALAPFLDLLNHSPYVQVKAEFNIKTKCYEIIHLNNIKKYHQVFINYGFHSNKTLFLEYGFVIPDNPNDCIFFNWDEILLAFHSVENDTNIEEKVNFLQHFNLIRKLGCHREGFTWNLDICLKVLSASNYSRKNLEDIYFNNFYNPKDENTYKRISKQILKTKLKEHSYNFNDKKSSSFMSKCLKLVQQFCDEERNLLIKNLSIL
ncbi:SET domain-containing protein 4 [Centruroides vittatus]|uniref:SET domain-containing protein 4 n=1 Tax=Centruroides vittatus TaxID=120091 RepID=UPI00350EF679